MLKYIAILLTLTGCATSSIDVCVTKGTRAGDTRIRQGEKFVIYSITGPSSHCPDTRPILGKANKSHDK